MPTVWLAAAPAVPPVVPPAAVVVSPARETLTLPGLPPDDPWVAAGLSFAVNGLGQAYNGDWDKAWWLLGAWGLYPAAWALDAGTGSGTARTLVTVGMLGAKGWACWDAWHGAARHAGQTTGGTSR